MSLGKIIKQNPTLLDTLYELNDLIAALSGKQFQEMVLEIKKEKSELNLAKEASTFAKKENDEILASLQKATHKNHESIASFKSEREALERTKIDVSNQMQKLNALKSQAEAAHKQLEAKTVEAHNELDKKSNAVSEKEKRVKDLQLHAETVKNEYETKVAHIKKITG